MLVMYQCWFPNFDGYFVVMQKNVFISKKFTVMCSKDDNLLLLFSHWSHIWLFVAPWTVLFQAPLSSTISQSLLKFMSIESVMLPNHLILCHPLFLLPSIFPSIRVFSMSRLFVSGGQLIRASASASVLPTNIQGWFPLEFTGLISLLSKGLSRVKYSLYHTIQWSHSYMLLSSLKTYVHTKSCTELY